MSSTNNSTATILPWTQQGTHTVYTRAQAQSVCRKLVEDPAYFERFKADLNAGKLAAPLEQMVWHYAYGKPTEQIKLQLSTDEEDFSSLSLEELEQRNLELQKVLEEAKVLRGAINATVVP